MPSVSFHEWAMRQEDRDWEAEFNEYARRAQAARQRIEQMERAQVRPRLFSSNPNPRASREDIRRAMRRVMVDAAGHTFMPEWFRTKKEPDWEL